MKIEVDRVPDKCIDCRFYRWVGQDDSFVGFVKCILTGEEYVWSEWGKKEMRKSCPFLKAKMGFIESRDIEGVYK